MTAELDYDPALVDWLRAQIDDDEQVAREASPGPWDSGNDGLVWPPRIGDPVSGSTEIDDANHIARWDPARVLAEVDAKRRLIDSLVEFMEGDHAPWNEMHLQLLALPYAGREGYRDEWRALTERKGQP